MDEGGCEHFEETFSGKDASQKDFKGYEADRRGTETTGG